MEIIDGNTDDDTSTVTTLIIGTSIIYSESLSGICANEEEFRACMVHSILENRKMMGMLDYLPENFETLVQNLTTRQLEIAESLYQESVNENISPQELKTVDNEVIAMATTVT